jgi:hypothetical protein
MNNADADSVELSTGGTTTNRICEPTGSVGGICIAGAAAGAVGSSRSNDVDAADSVEATGGATAASAAFAVSAAV